MRQRSPRQETSSRGADDFDDDGCRWCICGFRSFLLASAEMASNASSSRKEGRAPCSFKSLEGRSSKATGPSTTTTATEDRSLSLSLSLSSQQTRALSSSNSFPKSRASPSRACPTKSHDYPGQAAERQEEHGKEQSAGRGAKGPKTSTGLQREGEGKKPKCLLEWEGIISPLSLACVKSHGPAGAARALRAPTVAPLVDGRAATVPRAKAILERRGGGGVGRRRRRKTRERLSAKIVQSRESEREKKKKRKNQHQKKKESFFLCLSAPLCARIPFAPSLRETRGGSPKRSHATLRGRCCRESSSRRRVLAPGRVSLSFIFFAMLLFDAFGDVENAVDSSDIARISPASRASLPRSPLQSRA